MRFGVVEVNGVCVPGGVGGNVSLVGVLGGAGEAETRCKKSNRKFCLVLNVRSRGRCDAAVSSRVLLLSRVVLLTTL